MDMTMLIVKTFYSAGHRCLIHIKTKCRRVLQMFNPNLDKNCINLKENVSYKTKCVLIDHSPLCSNIQMYIWHWQELPHINEKNNF